jgi:ketosteroid isomerase-like protein
MKPILFLLIVMSPAIAAAQSSSDPGLIKLEQEWCNALKTADAQWFEQNLADDFTSISSGDGSLHDKRDEIAELKSSGVVYESLELSGLTVRVEGNAGIVTGLNHIKGHDQGGNTFDVRLAFTDTYIHRGGRWQVWASQHTRMP